MPTPPPDDNNPNLLLLRDALTSVLFPPRKSRRAAPAADPTDLSDTLTYLSTLLYLNLPPPLRSLTPDTTPPSPSTLPPPPPEAIETLTVYGLHTHPELALSTAVEEYITLATAPPPPQQPQLVHACELCERCVPLTFHHLIPRSTHAIAVKRGWHRREDLGRGAWLCAPCHRFVHGVRTNRELARCADTVEKLRGLEEVGRWVRWVGRVRWGEKRG